MGDYNLVMHQVLSLKNQPIAQEAGLLSHP